MLSFACGARRRERQPGESLHLGQQHGVAGGAGMAPVFNGGHTRAGVDRALGACRESLAFRQSILEPSWRTQILQFSPKRAKCSGARARRKRPAPGEFPCREAWHVSRFPRVTTARVLPHDSTAKAIAYWRLLARNAQEGLSATGSLNGSWPAIGPLSF